jgi:hypothetical protein
MRVGGKLLYQEICSSFGKRLVLLTPRLEGTGNQDADSKDPANSKSLMGSQCFYCQMHAAQIGLSPSVLNFYLPHIAQPFVPPLYLLSSSPPFIWAATLARGPPQFS